MVKEIETKGVKGLAIQADVMEAEVILAIQKAISTLGAIDILVNNAGIFELKSITESSLADYERTEKVNIKAVFAATMEAGQIYASRRAYYYYWQCKHGFYNFSWWFTLCNE
ncbi:MAG TPA: SDR family NAD(P)-dependent oxidoreductase [Coleofasciculaceae cyanobacterium]|jgi:3-oxoacyl-[acyl-carrier protein] reductase